MVLLYLVSCEETFRFGKSRACFIVKAPDGGCNESVLARIELHTSDGQDDMSKKVTCNGTICEYRR